MVMWCTPTVGSSIASPFRPGVAPEIMLSQPGMGEELGGSASRAAGLEALLARASVALSERWGRAVVLARLSLISDRARSLVIRCAPEPARPGSASLIVKWFKPGHD